MKNKSGQMLIEVLIVLAIVTVGLVSLISGVTVALKNTNFAKEASLANHAARQIMEEVRAYKDTNGIWQMTDGCYYSDSLPSPPPPSPDASIADCSDYNWENRIKIEPNGADEKKITVSVAWGGLCEEDSCHKAETVSFLSKKNR